LDVLHAHVLRVLEWGAVQNLRCDQGQLSCWLSNPVASPGNRYLPHQNTKCVKRWGNMNKWPQAWNAHKFFVKHKDGHKRILRLLEEIKKNFPAYPNTLSSWQEINQRLDDHTEDKIPSLNCLRTHFANLLAPYLANLNDGGKDATESKVTGNPSTGGEYHAQADTAREVLRKGIMQEMGKEVMGHHSSNCKLYTDFSTS